MKRCVIVGAGEFAQDQWKSSEEDYIIAADGGLEPLLKWGVLPDLVIGDMDSITEGWETMYPKELIQKLNIRRLPVEKDDTDMLAAIKEGLQQGLRDFAIYGALGGRLDHTIANLQCLKYLHVRGARAIIYGKNSRTQILCNDRITFPASRKGMISVFAFGENATGVTERGLKYSLQDAPMQTDWPIGVSNEFIGQESCIEVKQGTLLLHMHGWEEK